MTEKPIVAHIIRGFLQPTETFVANQINTLKNYQPVVFCHHRMPNDMNVSCRKYSVRESLPYLARFWDDINYRLVRRFPGSSAKLLPELAEKNKVRLLHFHYLVDARFFLKLIKVVPLPTVVSAYGYDVSNFPKSLFGFGKNYLQPIFKEVDCFLAMSRDMKRDLVKIGCPEKKIRVHYYGTDTDRFVYPERVYPEKETVNILMCGTLEPKKAQDRVLNALHIWEQKNQSKYSFRITFMGDGPLRPKLKGMVADYKWDHIVSFLGHVSHNTNRLDEEYRKADIFTLPSVTIKEDKEGIPGTIVEAMANGLPVVSTYHAGIPEVIADGQDGLLVEENDLEGLANALGRLIENRSLREKLGHNAAKRAFRHLRLLTKTPKLEDIYDQLIAGIV